ncbi:MAG: ANTAR domain-containing protein [Actinomycetota bacterium]|nr:ANTAR domain-containing protein [Actinomycetota bacterium]
MPDEIVHHHDQATRLVLDDLPVAVLWFDGWQFVHGNRQWLRLSALGIAACRGDGWLDAVHIDDRATAAACVRLPPPEAAEGVELRVVASDRVQWVTLHSRVLDDECVVTITTTRSPRGTDATPADPRIATLRTRLDESVRVAQAVGMISQRTGVDAAAAAAALTAFATESDVSLAGAAAKVVDRVVDIDSMGRRRQRAQLDAVAFRRLYEEHSAAVYAVAGFICGAMSNRVTEETFWITWRQPDHADVTGDSARVALLTVAHRRAMKAALVAAHRSDGSARAAAVAGVLRRGQAVERTLACAHLTAIERSITALALYGRCTSSEVAKMLGEDEHDVNHRLGVALGRLRVAESTWP